MPRTASQSIPLLDNAAKGTYPGPKATVKTQNCEFAGTLAKIALYQLPSSIQISSVYPIPHLLALATMARKRKLKGQGKKGKATHSAPVQKVRKTTKSIVKDQEIVSSAEPTSAALGKYHIKCKENRLLS